MRKKILIVDNNPVIVRLMVHLLEEQEGHLVQTAEDGLAALDLLQEFIPDIIFVDMVMPKISGDKLCRIIRSAPHLKHIPIVVLSGIAAEENLDYRGFGADACIAKGPFKNTSRHILEVLARFDRACGEEQQPRIYGLDEVYHRQATAELLVNIRHDEAILANISDGILECTVEAKIVYANPLAATLFRQAGETALLSTTLFDYFRPEERDRVVQLLQSATEQPQTIGEDDPLCLHDRLVSLTCMEVVEAEQRFVLVLLRDITALKRSEQGYRAFAQIGLALTSEKDIDRLLEMIVDEARNLSMADAGTLYIVDPDACHLRFAVLQNDTMHTRMRGMDPGAAFPSIPLYRDGKPNYDNVASYVALTDQIVNIPDVYQAEGFDFAGPRRYDAATGYRSKSMLVIPLKNHINEIIGVLQLLNAQDRGTGEVIAFPADHVELAASLASQAAIALTNIQLVKEQQELFHAFMKSIATAIDEKSPYTGGHIRRVHDLTMMIAQQVNETENEPFDKVRFTPEEMEELRLAAWMHDVGKITTPDHVIDKADKLETILSRIHLLEVRFGLIGQLTENEILRRKLTLFEDGEAGAEALAALETELSERLQGLQDDLEFIKGCNKASEFMSDEKIDRIKAIAARTYVMHGEELPFLDADEVANLCIRKGNLTERERRIVENHATMTSKILKQLPFPKNLAKVPDYASGHHEKLDGSGYPLGLAGENLPIQARIMAIADIFEALTARDRPYRKPMPLSQALKIMGFMKKDLHIDPFIFDLFLESGLFRLYAEKEMNPEQIDV